MNYISIIKNLLVIYFIISFCYGKDPLFTELSNDQISINAGFTGAKLVLFGSIDGPGDVAVAVTGPRATVRVRLKEKFWGIWLNKREQIFTDVPGYYAVASTRPLNELGANEALYANQIGINNLRFAGAEELHDYEREKWIDGLIEGMYETKRYSKEIGKIMVTDNALFKTEMIFPSVIPPGVYTVDTLLLKGGKVIGAKRTTIKVSKSGVGAKIISLSDSSGLVYGIVAVLIALFLGLVANEVVRKT